MTEYRLYDSTGRNTKPMLNSEGGQLTFEFGSEPPQNSDLVQIDGDEYCIQRVWLDNGELVIRLRQVGMVRC